MDATTTATSSEIAALIGVGERVIRDYTAQGVLTKSGRTYPLIATVAAYCEHMRKLAKGRGGEAAIASATTERGRLAREQADHIALKNSRARGELVAAADVETEWTGIMRTVRAGMLAVPSRCQQRLPHLTGHDASEIDREIREALTELGGELATDQGKN